ncbi:MAG: tryptophan 2,3-dioxygenase [Acidobacteriota bacterium]
MKLDYTSYLKLDELLRLQAPRSRPAQHDEMLFIIIHQVYELWFKLLLHEFEKVGRNLSSGDLYGAMATLKRTRTVMKTLVGQLDILETMTPMSFSSFRHRLEMASGLQSVQFRELEFLLGYKRKELLNCFETGSSGWKALTRRLSEPSVMDRFVTFLKSRGVRVPAALETRPKDRPTEPSPELQEEILRLYREQPELASLFELLTDFDEGQQEWRYRHIKMVERTIGNKQGTSGSLGVEFLKGTLFQPIFPDLWAVRHRF